MSILSQKEAFLIGRKDTIDLKYINAREYIDKIDGNTSLKRNLKKYAVIIGIIGYIASSLLGWSILYPADVNASVSESFISRFPEEKTIIGCYNDISKVARLDSGCFQKGDHNIMLPARSQIEKWLEVYNENQIINRLAIVNFESSFIEENGNKYAYGYVQTLKSHGVDPDIVSQLSWMKKRNSVYRQESYHGKYGPVRGCGYYWENNNIKDGFSAGEYGVLSCLYRYHYQANTGSWYAKRGMEGTMFYKWYMFDQRGKSFEEYKAYLDIKL